MNAVTETKRHDEAQSLRDPFAETPAKPAGPTGSDVPFPTWLDEFTHQASVTGYGKAHEAVNRISRQLRKRVAQLVGTRATTIRGAMAKLEIMSAIDHECEEPGIYEEHDEWLSIVRADLERIAGGAS